VRSRPPGSLPARRRLRRETWYCVHLYAYLAVALGFAVPTAIVALIVGPGQLLYWAVLGNGSYLGVQTLSAAVWVTFIAMTAAFAGCNLPLLWKLPRAWRDRAQRTLDGRNNTDLWLWLASAGISVAIKPRYGAYVVAAWLGGIVVNLLTYSGYYDVALRDFGLMLAALTLARLASKYDPPWTR